MGRSADDRVIAIVQENAASLLRLARQHSLCEDDAADAYQRTLEIYLERIDRIEHATAGSWLRTVCKHEAMRIRAGRQRVLASDEVEWDAHPSLDAREVDERAASLERVARAAEALQGCKPDEARAMLLRADGSSYAEIGELCGWTYTKVNRCLAEGRARFLRRFEHIESGAACRTHLPVLSAIVDGEATPEDFAALRPHLRHCAACRATLKAMYESETVLGALVPAGILVLAAPDAPGLISRAFDALSTEIGERLVRAHTLVEVAASTKAAAVVASTAAVAAGGAAAADHVADAEAATRPQRRAAAVQGPSPSPAASPAAAPSVTATVTVAATPAPPPPPVRATASPTPSTSPAPAAPEFGIGPAAPAPAPASAPAPAPAEPGDAAPPPNREERDFGFEG